MLRRRQARQSLVGYANSIEVPGRSVPVAHYPDRSPASLCGAQRGRRHPNQYPKDHLAGIVYAPTGSA